MAEELMPLCVRFAEKFTNLAMDFPTIFQAFVIFAILGSIGSEISLNPRSCCTNTLPCNSLLNVRLA
jgi:hypothetical protein